ncbi:MAG: hypothetical protein MZW92_14990 [Comamonadaceae bacterium]|nr:hypothetical protein [Comamonadaceae bacterium]
MPTGQWRAGVGSGATQLDFKIDAADVGQLLERLGYGMGVKRGTAKLQGKVAWAGAPSAIDYPSLDGSLSLEAHRGQFAKLEPGVGRLLGVLSLQALPRRISLDFRDVFSEGFAFDSITGSIGLRRGVMETQNLAIQGPSAKVLMTGDVSLVSETQNLKVRVQPTLSETVAIGAAVVNPLAGAGSLRGAEGAEGSDRTDVRLRVRGDGHLGRSQGGEARCADAGAGQSESMSCRRRPCHSRANAPMSRRGCRAGA